MGSQPNWISGILVILSTLLISTDQKLDTDVDGFIQHFDELQVVDLLSSSGILYNLTRPMGVFLRPGPHSLSPAAFFTADHRRRLSFSFNARDARRFLSLFTQLPEVTLLASVRQSQGNQGTLLSLHYKTQSEEHQRLFEVQSFGSDNELHLLYQAKNTNESVRETFQLSLADEQWHKLAIVLSGNQVQLFLDCLPLHKRMIMPLDVDTTGDELIVWIGQQQMDTYLFKGYLQNFQLVAGKNGHQFQCPNADPHCPTCGEFQSMTDTLSELKSAFLAETEHLRSQLRHFEERLSLLESCDCHKSCRLPGGMIREDGSSWSSDCQLCFCVGGVISCRQSQCPPLNCTNPNPPDPGRGLCCPNCNSDCRLFNESYAHGSIMRPKRCLECHCDNGRISCERLDLDKHCPRLECHKDDQILEDGTCCPVCKASHCENGHNCHADADCHNGLFNYSCHCRPGFQGNGLHCEDVDECSAALSSGQLCSHDPNSYCVNIRGSFKCVCRPGYELSHLITEETSDSPNSSLDMIGLCLQTDMCASNPCHEAADCISGEPLHMSDPGSSLDQDQGFRCVCKPGYSGNGTLCHPVCKDSCLNGGLCQHPDQCICRTGFSGPRCEVDVDECALPPDLHKCGQGAKCVNQFGWHYCECDSGFHPQQDSENDPWIHCVADLELNASMTCEKNSSQCLCQIASDQGLCSNQAQCQVPSEVSVTDSGWASMCLNCPAMATHCPPCFQQLIDSPSGHDNPTAQLYLSASPDFVCYVCLCSIERT